MNRILIYFGSFIDLAIAIVRILTLDFFYPTWNFTYIKWQIKKNQERIQKKMPKKNCPQCVNWRFNRTNRWCTQDTSRSTYTTMTYSSLSDDRCSDFRQK